MATETYRTPGDVPLPASESDSIQADEIAPAGPARPGRSQISDTKSTPCWTTFKFADFVDDSGHRFSSGDKFGAWMKASKLAVRELPWGGLITIPRPTDDPQSKFQRFHDIAYLLQNHQALCEALRIRYPDQEACSSWAEYAWDRWSEYEYKPSLVIFGSADLDYNDYERKDWGKDDLIEYYKEDTVKIWTSSHSVGDLSSPARISAEFHIILNSIIMSDSDFLTRLWREENACEIARVISLQHMGFVERFYLSYSIRKYPLFFHRISSFGVADSLILSQAVTATHRRDKGRFPRNRASKTGISEQSWFYETCISIVAGFKDSTDGNTLRFVFIIEDKLKKDVQYTMPLKLLQKLESTERAGFLPALLRDRYLRWEKSWNGCLDGIDDSVKITLEDISDDTKLDTFMFDGATFERSRSYFAALQLRIFSDRIKETRQDLTQAINQLGQHPSLFESTGLEEAESRLLQRIDRKTDEIKTLRDGLFNFTSVREATRATQMNRYVIVFTVVTVLYTPPSFISALFATPLPYFTKGDPDDFKRAVGIATGTTVLAAVILLVIANSFDEIVRNPKARLSSMAVSATTKGPHLFGTLAYIVWSLQRKVRDAGRCLQKAAEIVRQGTQASDRQSQRSESRTDQRHSEEVIDLSTLDAIDAISAQDDHVGSIV